MKRLLLLRHAKAVPHGTVNDFDRTLAERGRQDMALLAAHLASLDPAPDLALVSPASRTRETWTLCDLPVVPIRYEEAIYEASLPTLQRVVRALPGTARLPILVGHNPAFEDFAASLKGAGHVCGLPTAGLVLAEWDVEHWREATPERGRIVDLVTPSSLGASRDD